MASMQFLVLVVLCISCGRNAEVFHGRTSAVPYVMGGSQITFNLTEEIDRLTCVVRFPDGRDQIELVPSVHRDGLSAICRLPAEINSGMVDISLEMATESTLTEIQADTLIVNPSTLEEVSVQENWDTHELFFTWDPEYFSKFFQPNDLIMIQITVSIADTTQPDFKSSDISLVIRHNAGSATVNVSDLNMERFSDLRFPYFYILRAVGTESHVYLSSVLFSPTLGMDASAAVWACGIWLESAKVVSPPEEIHPCPPSLCKAKLDTNFIETEYDPQIVQLANGALANHVLYYERVPTAGRHAQTCSYNKFTENLVPTSPVEAGWIHEVSKFDSYVDNYFADVWPYMVCCLQSNSSRLCDAFHEKRPIDTGHQYVGVEDPSEGTGDPHMVTFESVKYDFMGSGEFWLIRGPEGSEFGVQCRMSPIREGQKNSIMKAVAIRDGNTTVQVELKEQQFQILLNGFELQTPTSPMTLPFNSVSITINGNIVNVRLRTGFTIIIENREVHINVFGSGAHSNKGKGFTGLFGNFDYNDQNDLTSQDGFVIIPTPSNLNNLSLIHHQFGLTWMVTAIESYFVYEDGKSWKDYANIEFGPILEYPDPSTLPEEVRTVCGDSLFCYYEYVGTGSLEDASNVAKWEREFDELRKEIDREIPMCEVLPSPANGRVEVNGYLNGSLASYSCDRDYDFISGNRMRTCLASEDNSYWIGVEPECIWTCTTCLQTTEFQLSHDPTDCTNFFLCQDGERFVLPCPVSTSFNRETLVCDLPLDVPGCRDNPGC